MSTRVINSKRGTSVKKEDVKVTTTRIAKTIDQGKKETPKKKG